MFMQERVEKLPYISTSQFFQPCKSSTKAFVHEIHRLCS
ncbi:unnamed protein product [Thelazia callipaeda]|uniref:Uncharacterized protein n=1 Tax=Thelazia callipaeda TaxID=103827 RepID=A0A0N5CN03_THECL|nr:unnamed protein product [Thelazia callipaeda]